MENLLYIEEINDILVNILEEFKIDEINEFKYNEDESYLDFFIEEYESSTSEEFKKAKKDYSKIKSFKEEVEKLEKDDLKNLFKNIIDNDYYEIADFLITKTDIDVSELLDLFIKKNSINKIEELLLSNLNSKKNVGFGILLSCIENGKNLDFIESLINNSKVKDKLNFYDLYNFAYINRCPNTIDFLIEKALSLELKKERLSDLIENIIKNNNLELFGKLLNKEKLITNVDFNKIVDFAFIKKNINIINILLQNKSDLKLESLKEEHKLFLLEYFFKNDFPEELKEKVISEILNKKEYICKYTNSEGQGGGQIKLDKIFKYDEKTKKIIEIDKGYGKNYEKNIENELLYKIEYLENNEKQITYFEKGSNGNKELVTIKINANNEIIFNTESINYDLETFQNKINEILEAEYFNIDFFDYTLSYLTYIPLQLQQNINNKDNIIFIADCSNIETIKNIINNSLEKDKYKNKTIICDFGYSMHNVQIVVCNGKTAIINTLDPEEINEWGAAEKIKARFDKEIDVKEISILQQQPKNCVEASKLSTVALAMQFSNDFENFLELNKKLNELEKLFEEVNKLSEEEDLIKEEKDKREIDYINKKLTNEKYKEYFKLLMTITNSSQQLISKSQHFISLQKRFENFKNNFLKVRSNIELSENDKEFINSIINDITGNKPESLLGLQFKGKSYEENIEHICNYLYKYDYFYKINAKNYSYTNPYNGENYEINQKMRLFLVSIKSGNIEHIHNYIEELKEYANNDKNLIKKNIKNIIETNFKTKNDLYTKEVINIFNKEIEKINLKEKQKIIISDSDISIINECLKKVNKGKNFKEAALIYSYDDRKQNEIYPHSYNENEIFLDHKTQCWLTAIKYYTKLKKPENNNKLLDEYIDEFIEKLEEFIGKNNKKQIKETLEVIKCENFEVQAKSGNIYAKRIVNRFDEEIEKADLEESFINFNKNKIELENKTFIQIENNENNKKTLNYINKLIEIHNNRHNEFKLKSIELKFTDKSLTKNKKFILFDEKEFNNLINKLNLDKQTTLNL